MSYTEIYLVPEKGEVVMYDEVHNSWRGAMYVWTTLRDKYIPETEEEKQRGYRDSEMKPVWTLHKRDDILPVEKTVLMSTFDFVMVKKENIPAVIDSFEFFAKLHPDGSMLEQVEILKKLIDEEDCFAVCWNQTSVVGDMWYMQDACGCEDCDGGIDRMYDITKDKKHWFLFEEKKDG